MSDWTPDPFDLAQGRGEHSRTTVKTSGGDDLGIISFFDRPQLAAGQSIASCFFTLKLQPIDVPLSWVYSGSLGFCYAYRLSGLQRLPVSSCRSREIQLHSKVKRPKLNLPRQMLRLSLSPSR